MKCPNCARVQKYRLSWMSCAGCGYQYTLDPKQQPRIGDRRVVRAAQRVGRDGRAYTLNQVVADIARRRRFYLGLTTYKRSRRFRATQEAVARVQRAHGLRGMIASPSFEPALPSQWTEPDLFDYGAERILVVDDRVLVDLLVVSGVHVGAKALVLTFDGYPALATELARQLVAQRPDIPVFVLHAATFDPDDRFVQRARTVLDAPASTAIVDLGLGRHAAKRIRTLRWARRVIPLPVDCLPYGALVGRLTLALVDGSRVDTPVDDGGDQPWWWLLDDDYG